MVAKGTTVRSCLPATPFMAKFKIKHTVLRFFYILLTVFPGLLSAHSLPDSGLVAAYPLDGHAKAPEQREFSGKTLRTKAVADRNGQAGRALGFHPGPGMEFSQAELPLDISPDALPVVTITCWIKAAETFKYLTPLRSGDKKQRGLLTDRHRGSQRWSASAGRDGIIHGSPALKDQWTFIALIYDAPNEQARLIVNNQVFGGRARQRKNNPSTIIGAFNGAMDELMVYNRALSLEEIEKLYGSPIDINREDFAIDDRSAYRRRMEAQRNPEVEAGQQFIPGYEELIIRDSVHSPNTLHIFGRGDTITVLRQAGDNWLEVSNQKGEKGYISASSLISNAFRTGKTKSVFRFTNWLGQLFMMNKAWNWFFVALFTLLLAMALKYRKQLNEWFIALGGKAETEAAGSRNEGIVTTRRFGRLDRYFPVTRPKWWSISPGIVFALMLLGGSIWDTAETQWFFNEGAHIIPSGFTLAIHWVLWSLSLIIILLILAITIESLHIAGPWAGLLRLAMLLILNLMAVVVCFYLAVGIILVIFGFVLFVIALFSLLGRRR